MLESKMKKINIQNLQPGMVIVRVTEQNGPIKIKKSGLVTSQDMVQGLIEMGIQQVEIDPAQTVELEVTPPTFKKSTTQKLVTSSANIDSNAGFNSSASFDNRADDNISNQFHRSLFLPTVQDLPTAWQFYLKRYSFVALVAVFGLLVGWSGASYQSIFNYFSAQPASVVTPSNSKQNSELTADSSAEQVEQKQPEQSGQSEPVDESQPQITQSDSDKQVAELTKQVQQLTHAIQKADELNRSTQQTQRPALNQTWQSNQTAQFNQSGQTNQAIQGPSSQPSQAQDRISPELLDKFNKALSQVSQQADTAEPSPAEDIIEAKDDVARVDQLPAWVLTELPAMSFSAHMYASDVQERWVRVNGVRLIEGDLIENKVRILAIEPQRVILNYAGQEFSMAALTDW